LDIVDTKNESVKLFFLETWFLSIVRLDGLFAFEKDKFKQEKNLTIFII